MKRKSPGLGRVVVVGLGQIGGSIAWRLAQCGQARVVGCDRDPRVLARARRLRIAHEYHADLRSGLPGADVVVLATPVSAILEILQNARLDWGNPFLVMDVGSTKRLIMNAANGRARPLPFVGGHPLAGSETSGLAGADPASFSGASFPLIPGQHAGAAVLKLARRLVRILGGRPFEIDAETHDRITGLTIGLPHVLALLLRDLYETELKQDGRVALLAGSSLRSAVRVSHSDPVMVSDLIASNRDQIELWWRELLAPAPAARGSHPRRRRTKRG